MKKLTKTYQAGQQVIDQAMVQINQSLVEKFGSEQEVVPFKSEVDQLIAELGYEYIYNKLTAKAGTKMEQATAIYQQLYLDGESRRCDVIREFMKQLDMSQDGAGTYFQNIKKKLGGR